MKKKHRHGEGSICKIGPCQYMAQWTFRGVKHSKRITASTRDEAESMLARLTLPNRAATLEDRKAILTAQMQNDLDRIEAEKYRMCDFEISELEEKYLTSLNASKMTDSTKESIHYNLKHFVQWCKEHYVDTIHKVDQDILVKYLTDMQSEKSICVYNAILTDLKKVWKSLRIQHKLNDKIFDGIKLKEREITAKRNITKDEIKKLLAYIDTQDIQTRCFWAFGLYCGMRKSDACMITWDNIDFEKNTITYKPIKTQRHGTIASVSIHEKLLTLLNDIKKEVLDSVYVLPTFARLNKASVKVRIRNTFKKVGIVTKDENGKTNVGFHSLRHGFISQMIDSGVPITAVAEMVGHKKTNALEMTLGYHNTNSESEIPSNAIKSLKYEDIKKDAKDDKDAEIERLKKENLELKERLENIKKMLNI